MTSISPERFIEEYPHLFDRVSRYVYFRIRHKTDAEDIISEVFLAAFKQLSRIDEAKGNLEQYIVGVARYQVIDYWYKRKLIYSLDEVTEAFNQADRLQAETQLDQQLAFEQLISSLPPDTQALFALHYEDGLTYQEIAALVRKKPATIRKLFSLMHQKLRKQFVL